MTVNPNPLCRAQWLFSTYFFFSAWAWTSPATAPLLCHGYLMPLLLLHSHGPPTQQPLHPDETYPRQARIPGCKFALGQECSAQAAAQGASLPQAVGKRKGVLWFCAGLIWGWMAVSPSVNTVGTSSGAFLHEEVFVGQQRISLASSVEIFALAGGLGGEKQMVPRNCGAGQVPWGDVKLAERKHHPRPAGSAEPGCASPHPCCATAPWAHPPTPAPAAHPPPSLQPDLPDIHT